MTVTTNTLETLDKTKQVNVSDLADVLAPGGRIAQLEQTVSEEILAPATASTAGIIPIASSQEVLDGVVTNKAVVPSTLEEKLDQRFAEIGTSYQLGLISNRKLYSNHKNGVDSVFLANTTSGSATTAGSGITGIRNLFLYGFSYVGGDSSVNPQSCGLYCIDNRYQFYDFSGDGVCRFQMSFDNVAAMNGGIDLYMRTPFGTLTIQYASDNELIFMPNDSLATSINTGVLITDEAIYNFRIERTDGISSLYVNNVLIASGANSQSYGGNNETYVNVSNPNYFFTVNSLIYSSQSHNTNQTTCPRATLYFAEIQSITE